MLLLHHVKNLFKKEDNGLTDPFASHSRRIPPDLTKIQGKQLVQWVFGAVAAGMSTSGVDHQLPETDGARGVALTCQLARSEMISHLEGIGVVLCSAVESSPMGSSRTAAVAEVAAKDQQVEDFAALGERRYQKVVLAAVRALMVASAVTYVS